MGALLEQYFQNVVVDKIAKQCQGIKNNLEAECNEIKGKINRLQAKVDNLEKRSSGGKQAPPKTVKKTVATKKAVAKKAPAKKTVAKKAPVKKK